MSDSFPLRPDENWYRDLVDRFGAAVPAVEHLQFRRGLQPVVFDLFTQLADLGVLPHIDIMSIETRWAGFAVIDARYKPELVGVARDAADFALGCARERLIEACEHCGRYGAIVAGDRFLCAPCKASWSCS